MSLILEALRKSEAERQLGRAPGLLTPVAMRHAPPSHRRWLLIAITTLVLLSAVAAAWWLGRSGVAELTSASESPAEAPQQAEASQPTPIADDPMIPPSIPAKLPTAPAVPIRDPIPAAGPADMPSDPSFQSTERESMPLPAPPASLPAAASQIPDLPTGAVEPLPTQPVAADPQTSSRADSSLGDEPPATPLRMLTAAERADLPPLRLNMHVFAELPERRFVMIDGRRLNEGDQVAANVVLKAIRRDGAVLEIRGHRVLIERP